MGIFDGVRETLRIALISQIYRWKSISVYRTQFVFQIIYSAAGPLVTYFFISVIYTATRGIPGWSFYQLLFLSSLVGLASPLVSYVATPSNVLKSLRRGTLDTLLLRPYSAFTAMMSNYGDPTAGLAALDASVLTLYAALHLQIGATEAAMFLVMLILGVLLLAIFSLLLVTLFYKIFRSGGTFQSMLNTMFNYGQYPLSIYGFPGTLLLTLVIPIGFATYVPAELLTGAIKPAGFLALAAIAIALMLIFHQIIRAKLKGYTSAMG